MKVVTIIPFVKKWQVFVVADTWIDVVITDLMGHFIIFCLRIFPEQRKLERKRLQAQSLKSRTRAKNDKLKMKVAEI
jgi:hypothetical protein